MSRGELEVAAVRDDGLQLDEDRRLQERLWTVERCAWLVFGLLVLAALAGLTGGGGPLSHGHMAMAGGTVEYPRIARWQASEELIVEFGAGEGPRTVTLSSSFTEQFQIESIQPRPARWDAGAEGQRLTFEVTNGGTGNVTLYVRPSDPGVVSFELALDGGASGRFSTIVLP